MVQNIVCLTYGAFKLCVDAALGGHVVEFSVDQQNALATQSSAIGSTFWPSPQSVWGWPPLAALDNKPYSVEKTETELLLTSDVCDKTGLQLQKRFWFEGDHLEVDYRMINTNAKSVQYAPWEITRISSGITFYKSSEPPLSLSTGHVTSKDGYIWHEYKPETQKENEKIFGNGSDGWVANANLGLLLVKKFDQVAVANIAPGEAEVEIYSHGDPKNAYIEMEQQGPYTVIESKQSYQWRVEWYLKRLPKAAVPSVGSTALVRAVEDLLAVENAVKTK